MHASVRTEEYHREKTLDFSVVRKMQKLRHVVMDMDGTIYCGNKLFDTTIPFFELLKSLGITYSFLTNNSSKSVTDYIDKLDGMGVKTTRESFYTSTLFTAEYLHTNFPEVKNILVLGTESMKLELCKLDFNIVNNAPDAVVVGYDTELTYEKLCKAAYWISQGAMFISTHPDRFCPTNRPEFIAIDCGWMTEFLERLTGKTAIVLGKPSPDILKYALKHYNCTADEAAMAGDRYNTDMQMAIGAGALSIHISDEETDCMPSPDMTVANLMEFGEALIKTKNNGDRENGK